jgi:hypothetical protein
MWRDAAWGVVKDRPQYLQDGPWPRWSGSMIGSHGVFRDWCRWSRLGYWNSLPHFWHVLSAIFPNGSDFDKRINAD